MMTIKTSGEFIAFPPQPKGCWAAYSYDNLISTHPTELEALRKAVDYHGRVVFLPWDMNLAQAIHVAEEAEKNA